MNSIFVWLFIFFVLNNLEEWLRDFTQLLTEGCINRFLQGHTTEKKKTFNFA